MILLDMNTQEDTIEIGDVENYSNSKDNAFSHQVLVMKSMTKVIDSGSKEMRAGWFENKIDKNGNQSRVYNEDTRLSFISAVESCMMVMECDLDDECKKEIKKLLDQRDKVKLNMIDEEDKEWNRLLPIVKQRLINAGKGNIRGYLDKDKRFYQLYLEECVKIYRDIFKALTNQTKRLDYYAQEGWEA